MVLLDSSASCSGAGDGVDVLPCLQEAKETSPPPTLPRTKGPPAGKPIVYRRAKDPERHLLGGGNVLRISLLFLALGAAIYRPLPELMCDNVLDKIAMHIIEPVLRLSYYYPTRLCPDAYCMMWWTRGTLNHLSALVGPIWDSDPELHMQTTLFDGVKVRIYYPKDSNATETDGAIIFIHGGGFVLGNTEMYESLTRTMAKQMKTRLFVSVDYRLAPETVFPGGIEDCEKVIEYVMEHGPARFGIDPRKIILMGDSAGGNLVAVVTQRRRERKAVPEVLGQILLYPLLQFSDLQSVSYRYHNREMTGLAFVDPLSVAIYYIMYAGIDIGNHPEYAIAATTNGHLTAEADALREELADYSRLPEYLQNDYNGTMLREDVQPNADAMAQLAPFLTNPDFAPLMRRDLSNLPSALVVTCEFDVLRDEGAMYAQRLQEAGVSTTYIHYPRAFHAFLNFHAELIMGVKAINDIKEWTMQRFAIGAAEIE